jgi:hypothetical protein
MNKKSNSKPNSKTSKSSKSLSSKAKASGIPLSTLRKVYQRGLAAWAQGHNL